MASRILDPHRFILSGAVVDWTLTARRRGADAAALAQRRGLTTAALVQLRWMMDPRLGLPTRAFTVWQRPHAGTGEARPIGRVATFPMLGAGTVTVVEPPQVYVTGAVTGAASVLTAYAGAPFQSAIVGVLKTTGTQSFSFSGPQITAIVVQGAATLSGLTGFDAANAANDQAWKPIEIVGLPVDPGEWADVGDWSKDQGPVDHAMSPRDAALDRYRRGAPFFGWDDPIEPGHPAPPWVDAEPKAILKAAQLNVLPDLRTMMATRPPDQQAAFTVDRTLASRGGAHDARTRNSPLATLMLGVTSDPLLSLVAGFGTAYPHERRPGLAAIDPLVSPFDFMVTARYERGLDGGSDGVEYAAIVFAPSRPLPPPQPATLSATLEGLATPAARDGRYHALTRLAWDQVPQATPFRVAAYAAASYGTTPPSATRPLIGGRQFDPPALQPASATTSQEVTDATGQIRTTDDAYAVDPAASPNHVRYAVAHEDLYGIWSAWTVTDAAPQEPGPQTPRLLAARLDSVAPAAGSLCAATLVVDLSWDWTVRSPRLLRLVGRLYPASKPGQPPATLSLPAGLAMTLTGGPGTPLVVTFNGADAGSVPGATLTYIADDSKSVGPTPVVVDGPRRYRLRVTGLALDFGGTGHVGLAVWAQGQEQAAPQRAGAWSAEPMVTSASDPRPPVITATHEDVQLASLADTKGEHHLKLSWPALGGAAGYFVYEASESTMRVAAGLGEAAAGLTLSDRLVQLRDAFQADPRRDPFTRVNATATTATSMPMVIPRGSKEIHLYLVLGVSAGLIESAWPTTADPDRRRRFAAYAAPQVVAPSPPRLEIARAAVAGAFRAAVTIRSRPGAKVARVDLYRVRIAEAALELDTMGPPVASLNGPTLGWTVTPSAGPGPGEAQPIGLIEGFDAPGSSWKRVYYRAVAVAADDLPRGLWGGRSQPTGALWTVVPPDGPPDLSVPVPAPAPAAPGTIAFTFDSAAPAPATDLGPHTLLVEALAVAADGGAQPLFAWPPTVGRRDASLAAVPIAAAAAPALWREALATGSRYHLLLVRPDATASIRLRVLLTDPLGRSTERVMEGPAAPPLPAPTLGPVTATRAAGVPPGRFVIAAATTAPFTGAGATAFTFGARIQWRPGPGGLRPLPVALSVPLPAIAALRLGEDPFTDPARTPLRRRGDQILLFLRQPATVALTITAPDGQAAHASVGTP